MKLFAVILFFSLLYLAAYTECYGKNRLQELLKARSINSIRKQANFYNTDEDIEDDQVSIKTSGPVYLGSQGGLKQADKINSLPGQPPVKFSQYSGYVTVDPDAGRALFYYFAEAEYSSAKPLVLWLNGGPGCSSLGYGAMTELGPFRVNSDGQSLSYNKYAWNIVSNVIFLESPAGVGFSYSNTSSDYATGDIETALDSYTFLINWFDRFPEYKGRDFYIAGQSYAGHYVPQLAQLIQQQNKKNPKDTFINLQGIAIGNALIDDVDMLSGMYDHFWTSALISDETHQALKKNCYFYNTCANEKNCNSSSSSSMAVSDTNDCAKYQDEAFEEIGDIDIYNIYAPLCGSSSAPAPSKSNFDPCSENYVSAYLNNPEVQKQLHVNITGSLPGPWQDCNDAVGGNWTDSPITVLPVIRKLMASGIRVWIYSGDTDGRVPVTAARYSMPKLGARVKTKWYPWYSQDEVGGYAVGYERVTFVTIRGTGMEVASDQPKRALTFFSSFLQGRLPPEIAIKI